jgi:hypothetical protein
MRPALKVVLATVLGTLAVLVVSGYLRTRREVALFDSDIRNDHVLIGTTLAVCVGSTWSCRPSSRPPALGAGLAAAALRAASRIGPAGVRTLRRSLVGSEPHCRRCQYSKPLSPMNSRRIDVGGSWSG